jgi:hypothetical protein
MAYLDEIHNGGSRAAGAPPLLDGVRGVILDALSLNGCGLNQVIGRIKDRTNDASDEQLFRAAIMALREQQRRIAELEARAGDLGDDVARLEDELADLEAQGLSTRGRQPQRRPGTKGVAS